LLLTKVLVLKAPLWPRLSFPLWRSAFCKAVPPSASWPHPRTQHHLVQLPPSHWPSWR
jgi:hypothetical protein